MTLNEKFAAIARSPEAAGLRAQLAKLKAEEIATRPDLTYVLGTLVRLQNEFPAPAEPTD